MGGNVWQGKKFKVKGQSIRIGQFNCFVHRHCNKCTVYEVNSGSPLGHGRTTAMAIEKARKNVKETPDLKVQVDKAGRVKDLPLIPTEEALRKLANGKN